MGLEGYEVVVGRAALLKISDRCAGCGGEARMQDTTMGRGRPNTWFAYGVCHRCRQRNIAKRREPWVLLVVLCSLAGASSLLLQFIPDGALALPWYTAPPAAVLLASVALIVMSASPKDGSAQGRPVRILDHGASYVRIWCANEPFAQAVGWLNGAAVTPLRLGGVRTAALAAASTALGTAMLFTYLVYNSHYPKVWIDALFQEPIAVYVDGERALDAPLELDAANMRHIRVPKGRHTFGWGFAKDDAILESVSDNITSSGYNIYNPGRTACYFRDVTVYGRTRVRDVPLDRWGPVDRRELYVGIQADYFFKDGPATVNDDHSRSLYRVSLYRDIACTELAIAGCPEYILNVQVVCNAEAMSAPDVGKAVQECARIAEKNCDDVSDDTQYGNPPAGAPTLAPGGAEGRDGEVVSPMPSEAP